MVSASCAPKDLAEKIDRFEVKTPAPTMRMPYPTSYFVGLPWCVGGSALVKMARVERRLTNGETWRMLGSCAVPLVGGIVVERVWGHSPAWNEYPVDVAGPIDQVPPWQRR